MSPGVEYLQLFTYTNIKNVVKNSLKIHCVADIKDVSEAGICRFFLKFFCISIIHPKKNLIKI